MTTNARNLANLLGGSTTISSASLPQDVPLGPSSYSSINSLPLTGNLIGDQAFVSETNRLYIWNGNGWYNVALINTNPEFDSDGEPNPTYALDSPNGDPTIIRLSASDPEEVPIQWSYIASEPVQYLADITQDSSVFTLSSKPISVIEQYDSLGGSFNITFTASDGINLASRSSSVYVFGQNYSSITQLYNSGVPDGIYRINMPDLGLVPLRYSSYNNKGWVEVLFSIDDNDNTPINNWIANTNSGWNNLLGDGTRYYLKNYNIATIGGLDYTKTSSIVLLGPSFNATDIAITSKSSATTNGIEATGQNQNSVLPLTTSDLSGSLVSSVSTALTNYFKGVGAGFHSVGEYSGTGWSKAGLGIFDISLNYRDGSTNTDEWHIADGSTGPTVTYYSNIGYRSGTYSSRNVGSWSSGTGTKNSIYRISATNVLSVWLTDM
jgi:hypothetical protein